MNLSQKTVLNIIRYLSGSGSQCHPSHSYLARATGKSVSTVRRAIRSLSAMGFIKVGKQKNFRQANTYKVNKRFPVKLTREERYSVFKERVCSTEENPALSGSGTAKLTKNQIKVYTLIYTMCDNAEGRCYPSVKYIAERINACVNTVRTALKKLYDAGYIHIYYVYDATNNRQTSNMYNIVLVDFDIIDKGRTLLSFDKPDERAGDADFIQKEKSRVRHTPDFYVHIEKHNCYYSFILIYLYLFVKAECINVYMFIICIVPFMNFRLYLSSLSTEIDYTLLNTPPPVLKNWRGYEQLILF